MKKNHMAYIGAGIIVVALVAAFLLLGSSSGAYSSNQPVPTAEMQQLQSIATNYSLANHVGIGTTIPLGGHPNYPTPIVAPSLTNNSKPQVLYIGAEYCPYCAITRWAVVLTLMRFGTLSNLTYMTSTQNDKFPNTPTFSFRSSTYSSRLVAFTAVETEDRNGQQLQQPSAFDGGIYSNYDPSGSIPFIDFANSSVQVGAVITPQVVAGMDQQQVISMLSNSSSPVALAIIGNANVFTAYLCKASTSLSNTTACKQGYVTAVMNQH
ncbi:MAG: DUF929 family protein [Candidatus Micrarchaeota archaeon]|nr:DUF929 family protein [Candidatus Micrarchaeota archaeon]